MAGFGLNLKLVFYLQNKCLTESLGFLNPPLLQAANRWQKDSKKKEKMKTEKILILFILFIFLILNISCVNYNNKIFFNKKVPNYTEVNLIKECDYKIDLEGYEISENQIDSIIIETFKNKNINLIEKSNSKYKLHLNNISFIIVKKSSEAINSKGFGTGQYGNEIKIDIKIDAIIKNSENNKERKIFAGVSDIKPVHTDVFRDFFARDSENKINPKIMFENSMNAFSHKVVKFILK